MLRVQPWRFRSARIGAALLLALAVAGPAAAQETIFIGLMSGATSPGVESAFKRSIEGGLEDFGPRITAAGATFNLKVIPASHTPDEKGCTEFARDLVDQKVVAILGPITTDCTTWALNAGAEVPIISPLATASSLTEGESRDRWFFRATVNDRERIEKYVSFIDEKRSIQGSTNVLLYQKSNRYAVGNEQHLRELLTASDAEPRVLSWSEVQPRLRSLEAPGAVDTLARWFPAGLTRVFVLGSSKEATVLANGLARLSGSLPSKPDLEFFFVGSGSEFEEAPLGSHTIGEPALEQRRDFPPEVRVALKRFGEDEGAWHARFYLTAYEAARYVVPVAIRHALDAGGELAAIEDLRDKVREQLETGEFDSLRPPETIAFREGELVRPPTSPIYEVAARLGRVDEPIEPDWLEIDVAKEVRFLESPIVVSVKSRGLPEDLPVTFSILKIGAEGPEPMGSREVTLEDGQARLSFHPKRPGIYRVDANVKSYPAEPEVVVMWMGTAYLFAALLALAGAFVAWLKSRGNLPMALTEGLVVGLLLSWLAIYVREVAGDFPIPIPSFGDDVVVNAALSGLFGGWAGTALFAMFLGGGGEGPKEEPKEPIPPVA